MVHWTASYVCIIIHGLYNILASGLRLLTSRTEFPGIPVIPGIAIRPVMVEVVIASGPSALGTAETDRPEKS